MISKTYYKYIWLLDLLLTSSPLTYEDICMVWEDSPVFDGPLAIRSFHEYRKGIKEMFGVDIACDRSKGNVYYVRNPEVLEERKAEKWLLQRYSIPQDFATYNSMKDRILLEEIPMGTAFLNAIIEAMQRNVELQIDYQRYERGQGEEHMQTFHFQPYALKVYNRRWYLLGYKKEKEDLRLISLDRIHDLKKTSTHFELPSDFDARKYFADVVGVYKDKDKQALNVKIRAYGVQAEYLRSTPLHKSQAEVRSKHGEFAEFTYRLCITPELISQLLAMGDKVEVLEPKELKEDMKKRINNMFNFYIKNRNMSNTSKGKAVKGSKYMMQMVASSLQKDILDKKIGDELVWFSPIISADYEEYQLSESCVCDFIGLDSNKKTFDFWPKRQPQWDGIAIGKDNGILYLFEAKSHLSETKTDCSASSETSKKIIHDTMSRVASSVYNMDDKNVFDNNWMKNNYQLANRLTFLQKMKEIICNAAFCSDVILVLVNFVNDTTWEEKERVNSPQEWRDHYDKIFEAMGITRMKVEEQGLIELEYSAPFVY